MEQQMKQVAYVMAQTAIFMAQLEGMKATNTVREHSGESIAYPEEAFDDLINRSCLHHNAVLETLRV